jgi:hypothetical protein
MQVEEFLNQHREPAALRLDDPRLYQSRASSRPFGRLGILTDNTVPDPDP